MHQLPERDKIMAADEYQMQIMKLQKPAVGVNDFAKLINYASYVDKTTLIHEVLDKRGNKLITVPKLFGKTTVISMLKYFLSIEVDAVGNPVSQSALSDGNPVRDTPNYRMFLNHKLKITENTEIMDAHLGKYPVIHVDFNSSDAIATEKNVATFCKSIVHQTFKEHEYLLASDKLSPDDKKLVSEWCDVVDHYSMSTKQVAEGLAKLSKFLFLHFNRQCFVLVDNYDSVMLKAVTMTRQEKAHIDIHRYLQSIYFKLLDFNRSCGTRRYVYASVLTGISYYFRINFAELNHLTYHNFLMEGSLARFYGFTANEVKNLLQTFGIDRDLAAEALAYYKGYTMQGDVELYNFWSISSFLLGKKIKNYWFNSAMGSFLNCMFFLPPIPMLKLMLGQSLVVKLMDDDQNSLSNDQLIQGKLVRLSKMGYGNNARSEQLSKNIYFALMTEEGYFTMAGPMRNCNVPIRVANQEIVNGLVDVLKIYTSSIPYFSSTPKDCIKMFSQISENSDSSEMRVNSLCGVIESLNYMFNIMYEDMEEVTLHNSSAPLLECVLPMIFLAEKIDNIPMQVMILNDNSNKSSDSYLTIAVIIRDCAFIIGFSARINNYDSTKEILKETAKYRQMFSDRIKWQHVNKCFIIGMSLIAEGGLFDRKPFRLSLRYVLQDLISGRQIVEDNVQGSRMNSRQIPRDESKLYLGLAKFLTEPEIDSDSDEQHNY